MAVLVIPHIILLQTDRIVEPVLGAALMIEIEGTLTVAAEGRGNLRRYFAILRLAGDDVDDAAHRVGTVKGGSRSLQDFDALDRIHIADFRRLEDAGHRTVRIGALPVNEYNDMAGAVDVEIVRRIIRAGGAVILDGDAWHLAQRITHRLVVVLLNVLARDHVDVGMGIEIRLRQTIRRHDDLVEIELLQLVIGSRCPRLTGRARQRAEKCQTEKLFLSFGHLISFSLQNENDSNRKRRRPPSLPPRQAPLQSSLHPAQKMIRSDTPIIGSL